MRCLLVGSLFELSLRSLEQRLHADLLVRWFVGLPAFGEAPSYSTLERFEQWVSQNQRRIYQDSVLQQIDGYFPHGRALNQIGDTYAMLAHAAEEDLIRRVRHTVECLLREAVKSMPGPLSRTVSRFDWHLLFGPPKERPVFLLDKQESLRRLEVVVLASQELCQRFSAVLRAFPSQEYPEVRLWVSYLGKILHDEVTLLAEANAEGRWIELRTAKERRNDPETSLRIGSATDPEATYRMHGSEEEDIHFGYNVQVAASTDGFIRETRAYTGAVSDQAGIAALVEDQLTHQGYAPSKLIYDQAAGTGKARGCGCGFKRADPTGLEAAAVRQALPAFWPLRLQPFRGWQDADLPGRKAKHERIQLDPRRRTQFPLLCLPVLAERGTARADEKRRPVPALSFVGKMPRSAPGAGEYAPGLHFRPPQLCAGGQTVQPDRSLPTGNETAPADRKDHIRDHALQWGEAVPKARSG